MLLGWVLFGNVMFNAVIMLKVTFWSMIILFDAPSDRFIGILIGMLTGIGIVLGIVVLSCTIVFLFSAKATSRDNVKRVTASKTPISIKFFNISPPIL
jgi:uncharacterized membrane protein